MPIFIAVALPIAINKTFTYLVPENLKASFSAGCRAVVPFGRRILTGIIVTDPPDEAAGLRYKDVIDLPDQIPLLDESLLKLTRWVADYYFCAWGEALKAALPAGFFSTGARIVELKPNAPELSLTADKHELRLIELLRKHGKISVSELKGKYKLAAPLDFLNRLEDSGIINLTEEIQTGIKSLQREFIYPAMQSDASTLREHAASLHKRAPKQASILTILAENPESNWLSTDLLQAADAPRSALLSLLKTGLISSRKERVKRYPTFESLSVRDDRPLPTPNPRQQTAIDAILKSVHAGEKHSFLLHGVTGSGKTLVYQKAIQEIIDQGGSALVLIPEISLTPQLVSRFRAQFGDKVGLQHSAMSPGERADVWDGIRNGEFPVVIGARSAVFAPLQNLRLIIVDEEGDPSFKQQEPNPRYNARDIALVRAQLCGAVTVLGSATPSIESYFNAEMGRYDLLELPERIEAVPLPRIRFTEPSKYRTKSFGMALEKALAKRLLNQEQSILLHNRRGFFTFAFCTDCGTIRKCPNCDVSLVYHKAEDLLKCHLCGHHEKFSQRCSECHGLLKFQGTGTEKIEAELQDLLPGIKTVRLDYDTAKGKGAHQRILKSFASEENSILLGTKMVARGHDFPKVTLVGVVNADFELAFPDFRSDERAFSLLVQAAGRAGRAARDGEPGEVI
ncbi:MAG: primosomal protein N', partial [bacterium]